MSQKLEIQPDTVIVPPWIANYGRQLVEALGHGNTTSILLDLSEWECSGWAAIPRNLYGNPIIMGADVNIAYKYYARGGGEDWSDHWHDDTWQAIMGFHYHSIRIGEEWL